MNDLVQRLSHGDHPIEVSVRPERTAQRFKEALDRGYVHIKFTDTRGGTELGFNLNRELSNLREADFEQQSGHLRVCGDLTLDYVRVRCVADIDLATLNGSGRLEVLNQ
jgi:hypothetical protein